MKIRTELNRQLYRQKAYGYEKRPYYLEETVSDAILGGDVENLQRLISSGAVILSGGMRKLSENPIRDGKYHFMITATFLAEICMDDGLSHDESYMIADIYSQKADSAVSCDDLQILLEDLAHLTNLNVSYLCKLFKQETGQTIKDYVTAAKMDTAQNLLKYSDLSCSEIATSLGYCSQSAFTYAFRQFTGTTPAKYRR